MDQFLLVLRFVLTALLYAFVAVAFYLILRSLRQHAQEDEETHQQALLTIETESAPDQRFTLRTVTAIGRSSSNHLVIDDLFASANHAIVVWRENHWWIEDLGSHNGTYLNDERVTEPCALNSGDRIRVGEAVLRFEPEPPRL
jgi:pSer/pThr/pTyr-binding forkhead associated (FHA) protein